MSDASLSATRNAQGAPAVIWREPTCPGCDGDSFRPPEYSEDRDDWDACDECEAQPVPYIRADHADALRHALTALLTLHEAHHNAPEHAAARAAIAEFQSQRSDESEASQ